MKNVYWMILRRPLLLSFSSEVPQTTYYICFVEGVRKSLFIVISCQNRYTTVTVLVSCCMKSCGKIISQHHVLWLIEICWIQSFIMRTCWGLSLDILKMESWTHMGRTANIIIKDVIHVFASISKIMRILRMGRRNCERCCWQGLRPGVHFNIKIVFPGMAISIRKIRQSWDCLIFIMGIPILIRHHL